MATSMVIYLYDVHLNPLERTRSDLNYTLHQIFTHSTNPAQIFAVFNGLDYEIFHFNRSIP